MGQLSIAFMSVLFTLISLVQCYLQYVGISVGFCISAFAEYFELSAWKETHRFTFRVLKCERKCQKICYFHVITFIRSVWFLIHLFKEILSSSLKFQFFLFFPHTAVNVFSLCSRTMWLYYSLSYTVKNKWCSLLWLKKWSKGQSDYIPVWPLSINTLFFFFTDMKFCQIQIQ